MPRVLKNDNPDDELAGMTLAELKKEYKKLRTKYDKLYGGFFCHDCGKFLPADEFYVSTKWTSGVIPTCKKCLNKIALGYNPKTGKTNETEDSFKKALQIGNLPFLRKEYNSAIETLKDTTNEIRRISSFQQYMSIIQSLPQYRDMNWHDSDLETAGEVEEEKEIKLPKDKKKAAIRRFGAGYTDGAYSFLSNQYEDWVARYTIESKAQEVLLVEICKAQYKLHEADINGEDTKDLIKSLQDLMGSLNIRPNQKDSKNITETKSFGQLIEMWEEEEPIPEPDEDLADVDNIGKNLRVWFGGWLAHALGLNVPISKEYEEEVAKYTIDSPSIEKQNTSSALYKELFGDADE